MAISSILSTAVSGLRTSATQVAVAADNVVNVNNPDHKRLEARPVSLTTGSPGRGAGVAAEISIAEHGGEVDLAHEFVNLIRADAAYSANAEVIRAAQELDRTLLDTKA